MNHRNRDMEESTTRLCEFLRALGYLHLLTYEEFARIPLNAPLVRYYGRKRRQLCTG